MNFLFKVVTSRIPKAKPSFNRQTGCRQGDSHFTLLLLHRFSVFYFSYALTYKQVLSPILLESFPCNHPPDVYEANLVLRLRAGRVVPDSPLRAVSMANASASWPGDALGASGVLHFSRRHQAALVPVLFLGDIFPRPTPVLSALVFPVACELSGTCMWLP